MRLIELLLEGAPGTAGVAKFPFQPGLNPWKQKGPFRLGVLVDVLATLFYPSLGQSDPLGPGKIRRAGVTFEVKGTVYRLVRDFVSRRLFLSQLEPGTTNAFRDLSTETRFITEALTRSAKIPSHAVFRELLVAQPGRADLEKPDASIVSEEPAYSDPGKRLADLKTERDSLKQGIALEERVDELHGRLFKIEEQLARLESPRAALQTALTEYEPYKVYDAPGVVTPQLVSKLKEYPDAINRKEEEIKDLEEKARQWTVALARLSDRPIWSEPIAIGGTAAALAGIVVMNVCRSWMPFTVTLLTIGAILVAGLGLYRGFKRVERFRELHGKLQGAEAEKAGVEKRFEIEATAVKKLFAAVRENDVVEIEKALARREAVRATVDVARKDLEEIETDVGEASLADEKGRLRKEISETQKRLSDTPPASMDPVTLDRQIKELERRSGMRPEATVTASTASTDEINRLVALTAETLAVSVPDLLSRVQQGLAVNISAMTEQRFRGIQVRDGRITGFRDASGSGVSWDEADPVTRAELRFAAQFTFWQVLATQRSLPLFLDLLSYPAPESLTKYSISAARHVARRAQMIVLAP